VQIIQSAGWNETIFNVNQPTLPSTHEVCPICNNRRLKDLVEILAFIHLRCLSLFRYSSATQ
jgi:hypothetical protein